MSLGLHLAVLERERVMPAISRPNTEISALANNNGFNKHPLQSGSFTSPSEVYRMKEFSLINHIESLKASAYGGFITPSNTQDFPHVLRGCQLEDSSVSTSPKWAIDPATVEGNLRGNSTCKSLSCNLEDVASRGSSCAKGSDAYDDDEAEKTSHNSRKKSAKASKRKQLKRKESRNSIYLEKDFKQVASSNVLLDLRKKPSSTNDLPSSDINSLTALCKSIKIHQKGANSISVKDAPYPKKSSPAVSTIRHKSVSPARASLSNAMIEYSKKHSSGSEHRRKPNTSVEEIVKSKVFLSDKQSGVISDCGTSFPCAPPATPTIEQLKRIEYVPSLKDIRSQRCVRQRLQILESKASKKEKRKQEDNDKVEKLTMREKRIEKKKKQRLEIYALNKLMTEWEHGRFRQFMSQAGSNL